MSASLAFLRFVAKAALNHIGFGFGGDFAVEVLPDIAQHVWKWWSRDRPDGELRDELQEVAQLTPIEAKRQAEDVAAEVAAKGTEKERQELALYLSLIPSAIRQSQRRPSDPTGRKMSSSLPLQRWDSLLTLLPTRNPRYKPGEHPPHGGDWVLEELLGMGGFGEVWKARHRVYGGLDPVALKFCHDLSAKDQLLQREAAVLDQVMKKAKHPGIVRLLDVHESSNCLEYEFVNGGELTGIIREARPHAGLPPKEAAQIIQEVADVIGVLHRLDPPIVHRDLKPANVLVELSTDNKRRYRVTDFGIGGAAANRAISLTITNANKDQFNMWSERGSYTPLYASVQQMRGDPKDPRDDVFALGVIWYQMLIGDLQVGAPRGLDWPDELVPRGATTDMIRLLDSCTHDNKEKRPRDAAELAEKLKLIIDPPPSGGRRVREPRPHGSGGKRRNGKYRNARDAAAAVLREEGNRSMSADALYAQMERKEYWLSSSHTPEASVASALYTDIQREGIKSRFEQDGRGKFKLRDIKS